MSNFFVALAVFVITVVGALFTVPYFIDWNGYRGVFEEEASRLLREQQKAQRAAERGGYRAPEHKPDKRARRLIQALGDLDAL